MRSYHVKAAGTIPASRDEGGLRRREAESAVTRLGLTLRCKGTRSDGVRTEREREKLRRYAESAGEDADLFAWEPYTPPG